MAEALSNKTFQFELVSPEKILVSEQAVMAVIPGEAGEFGVLADHSPLLSSLRPGVVAVTAPNGSKKKIFVAGGFADVNATTCSVLAEEAVNVNEIDQAQAEASLKQIQEELTAAQGDHAKVAVLQKQLLIAQARVDAKLA